MKAKFKFLSLLCAGLITLTATTISLSSCGDKTETKTLDAKLIGASVGSFTIEIIGKDAEGDTTCKITKVSSDFSVEHNLNFNYGAFKIDGITYVITEIADEAFKGTTINGELAIPDLITKIGNNAFSEVKGVQEVYFYANNISIGTNVFAGCTSLKSLDLSSWSEEPIAYPEGLLNNCDALANIYVSPLNVAKWKAEKSWEQYWDKIGIRKTYEANFLFGEGSKGTFTIDYADNDYENCKIVSSSDIVVEETTDFNDFTFEYGGIEFVIKTIGENAFKGAKFNGNVRIGSGSLESVEANAFDVGSINSLFIYKSASSNVTYAANAFGTTKINTLNLTALNDQGQEVLISQTSDMFSSCTISSILVSKDIYSQYIAASGWNRFKSCFYNNERFSEGSLIGAEGTFYLMYSDDFAKCGISIVETSFHTTGDSWNFNDGTFEVESQTYKITYIHDYAFAGISGLAKEMILPSTLQTIGDYAFANCVNLTKVTIDANLQTINSYAFANCTSLSEIDLSAIPSVFPYGENMLAGCNNLKKIIVPADQVDAYKTADSWQPFKDLIVAKG